jgi:hypothetical protein
LSNRPCSVLRDRTQSVNGVVVTHDSDLYSDLNVGYLYGYDMRVRIPLHALSGSWNFCGQISILEPDCLVLRNWTRSVNGVMVCTAYTLT